MVVLKFSLSSSSFPKGLTFDIVLIFFPFNVYNMDSIISFAFVEDYRRKFPCIQNHMIISRPFYYCFTF